MTTTYAYFAVRYGSQDCGWCEADGREVTVPDGITVISEFAFIDCDTVRSITVPNGVTAIGDWAFYDCKSLRRVTFPESVTFIGENAFEGCEDLKSIGGVSDSYAEIYASNQKIPFQKILLP